MPQTRHRARKGIKKRNCFMNKKILLTALAFMAVGSIHAQSEFKADTTVNVEYSTDKYKVETNRFWSNWVISAGGGVQVFFGDHDKQLPFGQRISPALDISIGKWFSPSIGARFGYSGWKINGATRWGMAHSTGEQVDGWGDGLYRSKLNYYNFHLDAMFNFSNIISGYKEERFYNCIPYAGVGLMRATQDPKRTEVSGQIGVLNTFRLSSGWDLNLDVRGTWVPDQFDGEAGGRTGEGLLTATIGVTYKIKPRGWKRSKTITRTIYPAEAINTMRERIDKLTDDNERLQQALAESEKDKSEAKADTQSREVVSVSLVTFQIGKSKLSNEARVNLGMMAEVIKRGDSSAVYTITGYADAETGSSRINERLSKARAEAVRDCLVKEFGVNEEQLEIDYKGGVENMFYDDPRLSRAVITYSK